MAVGVGCCGRTGEDVVPSMDDWLALCLRITSWKSSEAATRKMRCWELVARLRWRIDGSVLKNVVLAWVSDNKWRWILGYGFVFAC